MKISEVNILPYEPIVENYYYKARDDYDEFISRCVVNLTYNSKLSYSSEFCFTEQQCKDIKERIENISRFKKSNLICSYKYYSEYDMWLVEIKKKGRPKKSKIKKGFDYGMER